MNINDLRNGNFVMLNYQNGSSDVCQIEEINIEERKANLKVLTNGESIEIDTDDKWVMLGFIPFNIDFLNQLEFAKIDDYVVFGLHDNGAYVKKVKGYDDIIVRKEKGEWVLVTRKDEAYYGCRFGCISYLHLFQNLVYDYWHVELVTIKTVNEVLRKA